PVISMTDDLNSSPALVEATKLKKLLFSAQGVIGLFSPVLNYSPPERMWHRLAFEQHQDRIQQEFLSFDLNRRPPPSLWSQFGPGSLFQILKFRLPEICAFSLYVYARGCWLQVLWQTHKQITRLPCERFWILLAATTPTSPHRHCRWRPPVPVR